MTWIESHTTLRDHWKLTVLCDLLGVSRPTAIGHLHLLWWWTVVYAEDGDLSRVPPIALARAAEWDGDPHAFVDALVEAGFLERDGSTLRVHDWHEYCGRLLLERERQRRWRAKHRQHDQDDQHDATEASPSPQPHDAETFASRDGHVTETPERRARNVSVTLRSRDDDVSVRVIPYTVTVTDTDRDYTSYTLVPRAPDGATRPEPELRKQLFEALVEVCYQAPYDQVQLTRSARGVLNAAVRQLCEVDATPDEVRRRAQVYRSRWPTVDLTPSALVKHWSALGPPARASPPQSTTTVDLATFRRQRRARLRELLARYGEVNGGHETSGERTETDQRPGEGVPGTPPTPPALPAPP